MEKIVELVMRPKRQSDILDRAVLGAGLLSLAVAIGGTLALGAPEVAANDAPVETTEAA
ncbi:hypothetical protein [Oceaniglobus indicus]|uniref:hypothetical protein n=1 Tax=Oceaniglobus indicus TaxID=2047749 RepID=UPI0013040BE2|nr:hypothetical protein [Oceaniglobus indicus]